MNSLILNDNVTIKYPLKMEKELKEILCTTGINIIL